MNQGKWSSHNITHGKALRFAPRALSAPWSPNYTANWLLRVKASQNHTEIPTGTSHALLPAERTTSPAKLQCNAAALQHESRNCDGALLTVAFMDIKPCWLRYGE